MNTLPNLAVMVCRLAGTCLAGTWLAGMAAAASQPLRVVCFGDSTTAPRPGVRTYCDLLAKQGRATVNRGVPGDTTEKARLRFAADVLGARPDVAIIQFGINDSTVDVWKTPPATQPRVSTVRYGENLSYFVERLQEAGCEVILMTFNRLAWTDQLRALYGKPPYRVDDLAGFDAGREPYHLMVRQVAARRGAVLVDIEKAYAEYEAQPGHHVSDLLPDGMHPNTRGHRLAADLIETALSGIAGKVRHAR